MKTCPKCRRTYADSVDFCLRDGKPLVASTAEVTVAEPSAAGATPAPIADPPVAAPEAPMARPAGASQRPPSLFQTAVLQSVKPPEPVASTRTASVPTLAAHPRPWAPGATRERGTPGIRLTVPQGVSSQLPPWELVRDEMRAPLIVAPAEPVTIAAPEEEIEAPQLKTPDLPLPPEIREEAVPVGDETVLELHPVEEEAVETLELEAVTPPPEPEIPLISRVTKGAALPRPSSYTWPAPPVDESDENEQKLAIVTEEDGEVPVEGEDHDDSYVVVRAGWGDKRPATIARAARTSSAMLYGMGAAALLAACVLIYLVLFASESTSSAGAARELASSSAAIAPGSGTAPGGTAVTESVAMAAPVPEGGREGSPTGAVSGVDRGSVAAGGNVSGATAPAPDAGEAAAPGGNSGAEKVAGGNATGGTSSGTAPVDPGIDGPAADAGKAVAAAAPRETGSTGAAPTVVAAPSVPVAARAPQTSSDAVALSSPSAPPAPTGNPREAASTPAATRTPHGTTAVASAPPVATSRAAASSGRLTIASEPPGAVVTIDGQERGRTPLTLSNLSLGRHHVRVSRDGFKSANTNVEVDSQEVRQINLTLAPSAPTASSVAAATHLTLLVTSNRIGADVFVDDAHVGTVPAMVSLAPGRHSVRVAPKDGPDKAETVTVGGDVSPGQRESRHFEF